MLTTIDDKRLERLRLLIKIAFSNVCQGFAALSNAMQSASISVEKFGKILAENAERFKEYESESD